MITEFKGEGMYVVMYVDRETGEETREATLITSESELTDLVVELQTHYNNVEVFTMEEVEELDLSF